MSSHSDMSIRCGLSRLLLFLFMALAVAAVAGNPVPAWKWKVPAQAKLSGQVSAELEMFAPANGRIEWPKTDEKLGDFWVVSERHPEPLRQPDGRFSWKWQVLLDPPGRPGRYSLPATSVEMVGADGQRQHCEIPVSAPIEVVSVLLPGPAASSFEDLKDLTPRTLSPHYLAMLKSYGLPALLLLILGALGYWLWRRFRNRPLGAVAVPEGPSLPPHLIALNSLEKLLAAGLVEAGKIKEFHLELSFILRRYIEARFDVAAPESTTEEFLADIRHRPEFRGSRRQALKDFLDHCDLVKFAEHQPTPAQVEAAVANCRQFIVETASNPEAPIPAAVAKEGG